MVLLADDYVRQQFSSGDTGDMSMSNLQWTNAKLKQIGTSDEMQYDDAFTMQEIEAEDVANFNYIAGMVPFIQKIIADVSFHPK